jgi:hypothetical protein
VGCADPEGSPPEFEQVAVNPLCVQSVADPGAQLTVVHEPVSSMRLSPNCPPHAASTKRTCPVQCPWGDPHIHVVQPRVSE